MKLNNAPANPVLMSDGLQTSSFTIQASAKAFSILSDGLYSNKIRAIVRELSTNAYDSHVAAGKADVAFVVNIPNSLHPWFSVRDYGVGLDDNEVRTIYTSYFNSTKTDSDDFVGALGLGSKSPFSYTDNFTVTAIKNGRKGIYSAFINDQGVPSIALMSEHETDEPTGVEIRLSVTERNDIYRFADEAKRVYRSFAVKPHITGESIDIHQVKYFRKDIIPGVHIRESQYPNHNTIVMGNVEYRCNLSYDQNEENDILRNMNNENLEIHLPIGAVEVAASREELSYTEHTIKNIRDVYDRIQKGLAESFVEEVNKIENVWDRAFYVHNHNRNRLFRQIIERLVIDKDPCLTDNPILKTYYSSVELRHFKLSVAQTKDLNITLGIVDSTGYQTAVNRNKIVKHKKADGTEEEFWDEEIPASERLVLVRSDKKNVVNRVRSWCRNHNRGGHVVLALPLDSSKPILWEKFCEIFHNPPQKMIKSIDDFPALEKKERRKSTPVMTFGTAEKRDYSVNYTKVVMRPGFNLEDIAGDDNIYVEISGTKTLIDGQEKDVRTVIAKMRECGMLNLKKVYGIRSTDLDKVKNNPNWTSIKDHVQKNISDITYERLLSYTIKDLDRNWYRLYSQDMLLVKAKTELKDTLVGAIAQKIHGCASISNYSLVESLIKQHGTEQQKENIEKAKLEATSLNDRYPLVGYIGGIYDTSMFYQLIYDYVMLIENSKASN